MVFERYFSYFSWNFIDPDHTGVSQVSWKIKLSLWTVSHSYNNNIAWCSFYKIMGYDLPRFKSTKYVTRVYY